MIVVIVITDNQMVSISMIDKTYYIGVSDTNTLSFVYDRYSENSNNASGIADYIVVSYLLCLAIGEVSHLAESVVSMF